MAAFHPDCFLCSKDVNKVGKCSHPVFRLFLMHQLVHLFLELWEQGKPILLATASSSYFFPAANRASFLLIQPSHFSSFREKHWRSSQRDSFVIACMMIKAEPVALSAVLCTFLCFLLEWREISIQPSICVGLLKDSWDVQYREDKWEKNSLSKASTRQLRMKNKWIFSSLPEPLLLLNFLYHFGDSWITWWRSGKGRNT